MLVHGKCLGHRHADLFLEVHLLLDERYRLDTVLHAHADVRCYLCALHHQETLDDWYPGRDHLRTPENIRSGPPCAANPTKCKDTLASQHVGQHFDSRYFATSAFPTTTFSF